MRSSKPGGGFKANLSGSNGLRGGAGGPSVKKKMVIKPFKVQPKLPEGFEDATWEKLREGVVAVFANKSVASSREELYRAVEDVCVHKLGPKLYQRLSAECDSHTKAKIDSLSNQTPDCSAFLQLANSCWNDHCDHLLTVRNIFLYLDRSFVLPDPSLRSIWDMGLHYFRSHLLASTEVKEKLVAGLLDLIERERKGEDVDKQLIRSLLRMLSALGLYTEQFQGRFLAETELFYKAEGLRYMTSSDVPHFLRHVELRLSQEAERVVQYLSEHTRKPLVACVEGTLLVPHTGAVLERGFKALLDGHRLTDLQRMYTLFARVDALPQLKQCLHECAYNFGYAIIMDKENDKDMVLNLLAFKKKLDEVLLRSFSKNEQYAYALKECWERFVNEGKGRQNRPAELLAKFVDAKLKGEKGMADDDVEALLDRLMELFRFVHAKDVFEAFYKKDLAKRLLLQRSSSFDLEKSMISKLKTECGSAFTTKLEGMFKDIDLSRDLMNNYSQYLRDRTLEPRFFSSDKAKEVDVNVQVLTTGYWPSYPPMELTVPFELSEHMDKFTTYYMGKYQGRRIMWQHGLGHCVLKAVFPKGKKELAVSQLQAIVLLLFSSVDCLTLEEIKAATLIEDGELRRVLQSLACGKVQGRVLKKSPKGKEVEDGDSFHFNSDFQQKLFRIKINSIQLKETVQENEKTHEAVFRDRQYQVDAAIVRIMKSRKTLSHQLLVSELFGQLKFPAKPVDLKKRIESLLEREYLERDPNTPGMYNYLA